MLNHKNDEAPMAATTEASKLPVNRETTDMNSLANVSAEFTIFKFGESELRVINNDGNPWFVANDVCNALQLTNSRKSLMALDDDEKSAVTLSYTSSNGVVQKREVSVVSESGMYTLVLRCRDAVNKGTTPHSFRKWVTSDVLPNIRKTGKYEKNRKTTVDERTPLRDAVNMLVGKKGLRYDDAYNMVHQRFAIDSIDELELSQIPQAVEYIHRVVLDGEFIGKQLELPAVEKQFTDEEVCSLAWLWLLADKMREHASETYPALKQLESRYAGEAYDLANEFKYWLDQTMITLSREAAHIKPSEKLKCIDALNHLKKNQWRTALMADH